MGGLGSLRFIGCAFLKLLNWLEFILFYILNELVVVENAAVILIFVKYDIYILIGDPLFSKSAPSHYIFKHLQADVALISIILLLKLLNELGQSVFNYQVNLIAVAHLIVFLFLFLQLFLLILILLSKYLLFIRTQFLNRSY